MKHICLSLVFIFLFSLNINASEIKGRVFGLDENNQQVPLHRASVSILGDSKGVLSDANGNFKITVPKNAHYLIISYVGFDRDTVHFHNHDESNLIVILKPSLISEGVTVVGQKSPIEVSLSSPLKMETITERGLHKAACCNLAESFEVSPSVDVEYSDAISGAKRIQLLGLGGGYSQMLLEKVPVLRGLGSIYGLIYVPGPWMESIQVSKGAASVTTGFESITGQINLEFKKPERLEPTYINVYGDVMGRGEINLNQSFRVTDDLSTMFLAHGNYYNTSYDKNSDGFLDKPLVSQANIMNRWKYWGEHYESATAISALVENRKGGQKGFFPDKVPSLYGIDVNTQRYQFLTKNGYVFKDSPFSSLGTIVSFTHHNQESFYGLRDYNAEQNSFYANVLYQQELIGHNSITAGVSYQYDNYLEEFDNINANRFESIPGVFGEITYHPLDNLTILAGLRADFPNEYKTFITPRLHLKYTPTDFTTIRASAGKGFKIPHIFAEQTGILASSRSINILEELKAEEAWNYGINASTIVNLFGTDFIFNAEFYRTDFINQMVVDLDRDVNSALFYNLDGKSYSNSMQFDVQFETFKGLLLTLAYRLNDVKITMDGELKEKSLQSRHKGYFNLMYDTPNNEWNFDLTLNYNGSGRLPDTYPDKSEFLGYTLVNAQITKRFSNWDLYLGGENLTDFVQSNPIIAADRPFSTGFDSSMIWGPIVGRKVYAGIRVTLQ